jgi:hypothetical protein
MDYVQVTWPDLRPIFLTLTIKNVELQALGGAVDHLTQSWSRLCRNKSFSTRVAGWMRVLEVTYNQDDYTAHPHLHCILMVDKTYFSRQSDQYLTHNDWLTKWRTAARLDYDPSICIETIKANGNIHKAVAETAKYTVKDADYIVPGNEDMTDWLIEWMHKGLEGRRLLAYGGVMRLAKQRLKLDDPEQDGSLVDDIMRDDIIEAVEVHRWSAGYGEYRCRESMSPEEYAARQVRDGHAKGHRER